VSEETLTAEERAWATRDTALMDKLLRLYDAALARAQSAEDYWECWMKDCFRERELRMAAESRLAEATALLSRIVKYAREDRASTGKFTRLARVLDETCAFLSASPAPAAAWDIRGNVPVLVPAPAAESEPDPDRGRYAPGLSAAQEEGQ
jgi:hypothetical protein